MNVPAGEKGLSVLEGKRMSTDFFYPLLIVSSAASAAVAQYPPLIDLGKFQENVRLASTLEAQLGWDVAVADFNGDGYGDLLAGALIADSDEGLGVGNCYVLFGGPDLPPVLSVGEPSAYVTNIYGDDAADLTGWRVAAADVNGDGYDDAIIGTLQNVQPIGRGTVYIVYGKRNWPRELSLDTDGAPIPGVTRVLGKNPQDFAGSAVAAGDVNGDGFADVIIGAFGAGPEGMDGREGEVYILYGSPSLAEIVELDTSDHLSTTIHGTQNARAGEFVGCLDINLDGFWDVLVGLPGYRDESRFLHGKVVIFNGREDLPREVYLEPTDSTAGLTEIIGAANGDRIGWSFASGDVDGDGAVELLIGTSYPWLERAGSAGKMHILFNAAALPQRVDLRTYENQVIVFGMQRGDVLGEEVATGDFNGDGFADVLVGAPQVTRNNQPRIGQTLLLYGSPDFQNNRFYNPALEPDRTVEIKGYRAFQDLGRALGAGDLNGDGLDDMVIAAPLTATRAAFDAGEVYIIYGRRDSTEGRVPDSKLLGTYPNPFNAYTVIPYRLQRRQYITLAIYDIRGRLVRTLVQGDFEPGEHRAIWDGTNQRFIQVSSGVYLCRLVGDRFSQSRKIVLLR